MLPILWLLLGWLVMMGIFLLLALITLFTLLRNGVANFMTYLSTFVFITVSASALLLTTNYFLSIDWSQAIDVNELINATFNL